MFVGFFTLLPEFAYFFYFTLKFSVSLRLCGGVLQGGDLWSGEFVIGGDLQGGVICRRCNAKAVNLAGGEVRCGEIGAVISSAETSDGKKCICMVAASTTCQNLVVSDSNCRFFDLSADFLDISAHLGHVVNSQLQASGAEAILTLSHIIIRLMKKLYRSWSWSNDVVHS